MKDTKSYVLVNKPYDGGPIVYGPYTFAEADNLLRAGAARKGHYDSSCGYWSNLPCWWIDDTNVWLMRELKTANLDDLLLDEDDEEFRDENE